MCGKFTALASWSEVVAFSQPLTESGGGEGPSGDDGSNDEIVTYRVGGLLPVIVWDAETRARRVVKDALGVPGPEGLAAATADPRAIRNHRREGAVSNALPRGSARHRYLPHLQRRRRGREAVRQDGNPAMDGRPEGRPAARLRLRVAAVRDFRSARPHAGLRNGDGVCQRTHTPHDQVPRGRSPHAGDPGRRRLVDVVRRRRRNPSGG